MPKWLSSPTGGCRSGWRSRQNALVGRMQSQMSTFKVKLLGYGFGFVVLVLALAWLMYRHMRSETGLRATNRQLVDLTENLVAARDAAVRSSEAKSNFLANVSHELRTPLNAILGFSEALMSSIFGPLAGRQAEYIGDIHYAGKRLLALINDILDLSKLEAGKLETLGRIPQPDHARRGGGPRPSGDRPLRRRLDRVGAGC